MIRIVKMTFLPEHRDDFLENFYSIKERIRNFNGCSKLSLVNDQKDKNVFFTISEWDSEESLGKYRGSELFKNTWKRVKPMFAERAEAWSTEPIWQDPQFL